MARRFFSIVAVAAVFASWPVLAQPTPAAPATAQAQPEQRSATGRRIVPDTLMFTVDELNDIKSRIQSGATLGDEQAANSNADKAFYLSSILYYGPNEWTIWVNGRAIGPNQDFETFRITEITPHYVQLLVPLSALGMRPIRLEPNQTFVAESGVVIEGPWQ